MFVCGVGRGGEGDPLKATPNVLYSGPMNWIWPSQVLSISTLSVTIEPVTSASRVFIVNDKGC